MLSRIIHLPLIDEIAEEIEQNLTLIGATAVEDRLQDNVPQTIYDLIRASNYIASKKRIRVLTEFLLFRNQSVDANRR